RPGRLSGNPHPLRTRLSWTCRGQAPPRLREPRLLKRCWRCENLLCVPPVQQALSRPDMPGPDPAASRGATSRKPGRRGRLSGDPRPLDASELDVAADTGDRASADPDRVVAVTRDVDPTVPPEHGPLARDVGRRCHPA